MFRDCELVPLLGFDCEWRSCSGSIRRPVAVLQLESYYGVCALIQLRYFSKSTAQRSLVFELKRLLENSAILKIGVAPQHDANLLFNDFGIETASTYDLRFMAKMAGYEQPGGLKKMCENYLHIQYYDRDYYMHYHWEDDFLTSKAIQYAANDVHRSIDLFEFFAKKVQSIGLFEVQSIYMERMINQCLRNTYLRCFYGSWLESSFNRPIFYIEFERIYKVISKQNEKKYRLPMKNRCFVCKFFEIHHTYFPCK